MVEKLVEEGVHEPHVKRDEYLPVSTSYEFINNGIVVEDFVGQEPSTRPSSVPSRDMLPSPKVSLFVMDLDCGR